MPVRSAMLARALKLADYSGRIARLVLLLAPLFVLAKFVPRTGRRLWLFAERAGEARDNAYVLYCHVRQHHPGIRAVYAISRDSRDAAKFHDSDELVHFGSLRHYWYFVRSEVALSTHIYGASPIGVATRYIRPLFRKKCIVNLKHGVHKDHYSAHHKLATDVDVILISASPEYQYFREHGGYDGHELAPVGLPRFDRLSIASSGVAGGTILFMPTFRKNLFDLTRMPAELAKSAFMETDYYHAINAILNNQAIIGVLHAADLSLKFYPHPAMRSFLDCFRSDKLDSRVLIADDRDDVSELIQSSAGLITDYSSVFFDFAYQLKPVIYYQFGYDEYRAGHYQEGYFSYERDGFGPVCKNAEHVAIELREMMGARGMAAEFAARVDDFFIYRDQGSCDRAMTWILGHPKVRH